MFKIKMGDKVKIIAGKDRGKTGKVIQIFRKEGRLVVEGANLFSKHLKPRTRNTAGQRVQFSAPLQISNVMLICPKCSVAVRVGKKTLANHQHARRCVSCKEVI